MQSGGGVTIGQTVVVPPKPIRPSVVASRVGRLFFQEGEIDIAKVFWQRALDIEPQGATKARIGLAELALRRGDSQGASQFAVDALRVGKFQAKTLPALSVLLRANARQGIVDVNPWVLQSLGNAKKGIKARGTLLIVTELRSLNNPAWTGIAQQWIESDGPTRPIEYAELRKIMLSSQTRMSNSLEKQIQAATDLQNAPSLSLREWLSGNAVREFNSPAGIDFAAETV